MILLTLLIQMSNVSAESSNQEKAIGFLRDVAGLDMAKYNLTNSMEFPGIKYTFTGNDSTIDMLCDYRNDVLVACALFPMSGSPILSEPVTDSLAAAKNLVDRYYAYSKVSYVQQMQDTLNMITALKVDSSSDSQTLTESASASVGNLTLTVWTSNILVEFEWMNTVNGIKNIYNRAIFTFNKGVFDSFADDLKLYPVGSAYVKFSKEQALNVAVERAKTFSYDVGNVTVGNMTVATDFLASAEVSMQPRNGLLYPHWEIYLPLDRVYPGNVVSIRVMMWADTGEIDSMTASSTLGDLTPTEEETTPTPSSDATTEPTASPSPTPIQAEPTTPQSTNNSTPTIPAVQLIAIVTVATVIVVAVLAAFFLKRKDR